VWTGAAAAWEGRLYRVEDALVLPAPDHRIPIWLGMYKRRGLALTGREADGWIPSIGFAPPPVVGGLWDQVRAVAREAGRDPAEITAAYNMLVQLGAEQPGNVMAVAGSAESVADHLLGFTKLGFSSFNVVPVGGDKLEQIEQFGREVIPALRSV
jgi:alkanesulfonate monooxygenase SsuD/methylene tetrahydromethanopterin reductase-like flavin-dependent oxidoreductase (luciferase family)